MLQDPGDSQLAQHALNPAEADDLRETSQGVDGGNRDENAWNQRRPWLGPAKTNP